jgi:pullulanase
VAIVRVLKIKRVQVRALIAIIGLFSFCLPAIAQAIPSTVTLTVHYQRPGGDYQNWNLWLWKNLSGPGDVDVDSNGVSFTSEDAFGKIAKVQIDGMEKFENLGIIVRKGSWESKDIDEDRFIKEFPANGNVEVWLRQGDPVIHYSIPTTPVPKNPALEQIALYDSPEFNAKYTYTGNDLGVNYTKAATTLRVWAPTAKAVNVVIYEESNSPYSSGKLIPMKYDVKGTWVAKLKGNQDGTIFNYRVQVNGANNEAVDPYVRATTVNGLRGVIVDLSTTNPNGWNKSRPKFSGKPTDAFIYELHVRDLSMDASSGFPAAQKGKYVAFTNTNTAFAGQKTGISAIKDLGVTHVELLPIFDFATVDENNPTFNWGYDPQNYNVPEGSYSTDPTNPKLRIKELKSAILALHKQGLRVNMDAVYNHVSNASTFSQNLIVPNYFFRRDDNGNLTNGSGCGNDVASERPMVRKFIVDSVKYWANEYNMDGFRFDLMGLMDIRTINEITAALKKIDPTILVIGEGWTMGTLPANQKANQLNIQKLNGVSHFNDQIRDGIKGSVFDSADTGFATGKFGARNDVMSGIVGNVDYSTTINSKWTTAYPGQSVSYVESHDNMTLADKIKASVKDAKPTDIAQLSQFSASIAFLSQGLPFMQAGQEFLRSKNGDPNSYKSSDAINSIKWNTRKSNMSSVDYYKGLIALRKSYSAFRMTTTAQVKSNLKFSDSPEGTIVYTLNGAAVKDKAATIVVIHNANLEAQNISLPKGGTWSVLVEDEKAGTAVIRKITGTSISVKSRTTMVLTQ